MRGEGAEDGGRGKGQASADATPVLMAGIPHRPGRQDVGHLVGAFRQRDRDEVVEERLDEERGEDGGEGV